MGAIKAGGVPGNKPRAQRCGSRGVVLHKRWHASVAMLTCSSGQRLAHRLICPIFVTVNTAALRLPQFLRCQKGLLFDLRLVSNSRPTQKGAGRPTRSPFPCCPATAPHAQNPIRQLVHQTFIDWHILQRRERGRLLAPCGLIQRPWSDVLVRVLLALLQKPLQTGTDRILRFLKPQKSTSGQRKGTAPSKRGRECREEKCSAVSCSGGQLRLFADELALTSSSRATNYLLIRIRPHASCRRASISSKLPERLCPAER